jgi:hypothetical protein
MIVSHPSEEKLTGRKIREWYYVVLNVWYRPNRSISSEKSPDLSPGVQTLNIFYEHLLLNVQKRLLSTD